MRRAIVHSPSYCTFWLRHLESESWKTIRIGDVQEVFSRAAMRPTTTCEYRSMAKIHGTLCEKVLAKHALDFVHDSADGVGKMPPNYEKLVSDLCGLKDADDMLAVAHIAKIQSLLLK